MHPSEAAPARADNPTVFANVGPKVRASDKIEVKSEPPTCFLMLVLASFISIPFLSLRFFSNLFTTFEGTKRVSFPMRASYFNLSLIVSRS